jgi:NADH-quinone oxidoreductase subunit M
VWSFNVGLNLLVPLYTHSFIFGFDGVSILFIMLTTFLVPLCLLTSWKHLFQRAVDYCFNFILLELFLVLSFASLDLVTFFIFFEGILIPMFFLIGMWGSRQRRVRAAILFFLYTLLGSVFLFFSLLLIYFDTGTTSLSILSKTIIDYDKQLLLWLFLFFSFSVKIPTVPVHTWLPEAHVEAPTAGSVVLAGILLKLGGYGFLRILLPIFPKATVFYGPLIDTFALISIVYASLTTIRQVDLKRIIAYSSIAHMNLVVLGIFSGNVQGVSGAIFLMLAHGVVSAGLFFLIGFLYDKYHTRLLFYYGGLIQTMPLFSSQLLVLCLANTGLPGSCNFIGELVVFVGLIDRNFFVTFIAVTGVILSVLYSVYFFNRLALGNINTNYIIVYKDITTREVFIMGPLIILTVGLGFYPAYIFDITLASVSLLVEKSKCV